MPSDETKIVYQVKWSETKKTKRRGIEESEKEYHTTSETIGQNHAQRMSGKWQTKAHCLQWQVGDGPTDFLIQTWTYENGEYLEHHMMSKEGKVITRPTTDPKLSKEHGKAVEQFPDLPRVLDRKYNGIVTRSPSYKENDMTNSAVSVPAKSIKSSAPAKVAASAKAAAKPAKNGKAAPTKAAAKKPAKAAAKKPAAEPAEPFKGKKPTGSPTKLFEMFELREGTKIYKFVQELFKHLGTCVSGTQLLKAAYGSTDEKNRAPMQMVIGGVRNMIQKKKIPVQLVATVTDKGDRGFGIYAK